MLTGIFPIQHLYFQWNRVSKRELQPLGIAAFSSAGSQFVDIDPIEALTSSD
jgi:hypothetical protein